MPDASSKSSNTALAILTAAYVLCYVDRTIVTLMVGPTRTDLGLNDTQFSLLGGLGSGLIDHNQKMTVAAMQMADMKVCAHRS